MELLVHRGIAWPELEALQKKLVDQVTLSRDRAFLLVSEPLPTYTYGKSARAEDLLWTDVEARGIQLQAVERGGKWTYHGPGQILVFPILSLAEWGYPRKGVRRLLTEMAESVRGYLESRGIWAELRWDPFGLYVGGAKIASFGVNVQNGVSSHGLAVYLETQNSPFAGIVPCGAAETRFGCVRDHHPGIEWHSAAIELSGYIKRGFQESKKRIPFPKSDFQP